jgi:DNA polymerase-3 subunit alpha
MVKLGFVHLHVHSDYSSLDGLGTIPKLVARAKEMNQKAIAITDHGNMYNVYELYSECKKQGVQPIYGCEFYHKVEGIDKSFHIITLAKTMKGIKNLYKLHKIAHESARVGKFGKIYPQITYEDLIKHKEDIIVTTACLGSHVSYMIEKGLDNELYNTIEMLQLQFGEDFYLELQSNTLTRQKYVNEKLIEIGKLYNIQTIITSDSHYVLKEDAYAHEVLLCIQSKNKMNNNNRFKFDVNDFWLKSEDEILNTDLNKNDIKNAINNTLIIANKCNFELELPSDVLPIFSENENHTLRKLVTDGWNTKKHEKGEVEKERVKYELSIIESKGYSGYFLIVQDYINKAKEKGVIVGKGRGSSAGSFVAYLLGITDINPIEHGLLFERFLNPERESSPDIDTDFSEQQIVYDYLIEKWGKEHVSQINAFGKLTVKSVFSKVLSAFGFENSMIKKCTKSFPKKLNLTLADCEDTAIFKNMRKTHSHLIDIMYKLEGVIDHTSKHPAGILITPQKIEENIPVTYDKETGMMISGFDKYMLEKLGYYKFDILKLGTLKVIEDTLNLIGLPREDILPKDYNDENVYKDLCGGNVFGVFQLETQQDMTIKLQPEYFKALTALNALIRPGSNKEQYLDRKNGEPFHFYHESEKEYMESTYNSLVYQEQIALRVKNLANWTLGKGDSLRKEKNISENGELYLQFKEDALNKGILTEDNVDSVWYEICEVLDGGYGFNLSHACVYADLSYTTAYLKHYYPLEFMCALMNNKYDDKEVLSERINQCRLLGIEVTSSNINSKEELIQINDGKIQFGIGSVSSVGGEAIKDIKEKQPFTSFEDFVARKDNRKCNVKTVIQLIKAGFFDIFQQDRVKLIKSLGVKSVDIYSDMSYNEKIRSQFEYEAFGFYINNPLYKLNFKQIKDYEDGDKVLIAGTFGKIKTIVDSNKNKMAFANLITETCNVDCILFSSTYNNYKDFLTNDKIYMVTGKKDGAKVLVDTIKEVIIDEL